LRTLVIAYKYIPEDYQPNDEHNIQGVYEIERSGFTFLCLTGIRDILRPTVKHSVKQCQIAGIKVRMITGDNPITAEAIAKDCGIIRDFDKPGY